MNNQLIQNEIRHGEYIADMGEEVWHWSSPAGRLRWARRVELFKTFLGDDHKKVLEIGCGTGLFTAELAQSNNNIIAIDVSPTLLALARTRVGNSNVSFVEADAHNTLFSDNSFDWVVGSSTLHHLKIVPALKEIYRLLKSGGGLIFTEPNMLNPQIALERNIPLIRRLAHNSPDETAFFRWSLSRQLRQSGFQEVNIAPFDFMHPAIPQIFLPLVSRALRGLEAVPLLKEIAGSLIIKAIK